MDKRKAIGRTTADLAKLFQILPDATLCVDLAHAKQVDPSMVECAQILRAFKDRLCQIHISDVTSESRHVPLNVEAINAYRKIARLIPENVPIILESPVSVLRIQKEIENARRVFESQPTNQSHAEAFINESLIRSVVCANR
jgi:hypothetical protein